MDVTPEVIEFLRGLVGKDVQVIHQPLETNGKALWTKVFRGKLERLGRDAFGVGILVHDGVRGPKGLDIRDLRYVGEDPWPSACIHCQFKEAPKP